MELKDKTLLKALLEEQHKSARHMAKVAGYKSHTYMQRLLRGEAKNLEPIPAARIAHDLGVPFNLLFRTKLSSESGQDVRNQKKAS